MVDIDTIQYDNYAKGQMMDPNVQCNLPVVSPANREIYNNVKTELLALGQQISLKMENLYTQNNKIYEQMNMNASQYKKKLEMYKNTSLTIKNEIKMLSNNIEGMQNLNISDINGMFTDTDLRVIQENYNYAFWGILAIAILIVTINTMKN
jgi:predicted transport protein